MSAALAVPGGATVSAFVTVIAVSALAVGALKLVGVTGRLVASSAR
jgi:hypothetical protein